MRYINLLPLVLVVIMAGCSGDSSSSDQPGALQGTVIIGPLCPVEPCAPNPGIYTSHKLVILRLGVSFREVSMDGMGHYSTQLPEGHYTVDFTPHDIGIPGKFVPPETVVEAGKTTTLDIHIDTGIR